MATWAWSVEGEEVPASPGSTRHMLEASGTVEAELAGDVMLWLAHRGPFWDELDTDEPFTLTIRPLPDEEQARAE